MTKRQIQICPACNRAMEIMWVHGHGQCSFCKTNIDPCCSVGFQEKEAQLLVILSIVLNLIPQLNLLSVKICQSNWILNKSFCLNGTVLGNLDDRFCLNSMVFIGNLDDRANKESPSQTIAFAVVNKRMTPLSRAVSHFCLNMHGSHPFRRDFPKKKEIARS